MLSTIGVVPVPVYDGEEILKANIQTRSKQSDITSALQKVRPDVKEYIKNELPNLKWMLELPQGSADFTSHFVNLFQHSKINRGVDDEEVWFNVNGLPARFGMQEFVLMTGMNVYEDVESHVVAQKKASVNWVYEIFPNHKRGKIFPLPLIDMQLDVWNGNHSGAVPMDTTTIHNYARLLMVLLIGLCMYCRSHKKEVTMDLFGLLEDLKWANGYSWGNVLWLGMLHDVKDDVWNRSKEEKNRRLKYNMTYFAVVFQAWICETVPQIAVVLADKSQEAVIPRINSWKWKINTPGWLESYALWNQINRVVPTLVPTAQERDTWAFQSFIMHQEILPSPSLQPAWTSRFRLGVILKKDGIMSGGIRSSQPATRAPKRGGGRRKEQVAKKRKQGEGSSSDAQVGTRADTVEQDVVPETTEAVVETEVTDLTRGTAANEQSPPPQRSPSVLERSPPPPFSPLHQFVVRLHPAVDKWSMTVYPLRISLHSKRRSLKGLTKGSAGLWTRW